MLDRLLSAILPRRPVPPAPRPPDVATTPPSERRRIDSRLKDVEAHLAELLSLAGLDEIRTRRKEPPRVD